MAQSSLPLLIEPAELAAHLNDPNIRLVDVGRAETYARTHLPGAVHLDYARIVAARPPAGGLLPDAAQLADVLGGIGLTPAHHVVAYDNEGNGKAARFLWTLDAVGHVHASLLNGGLDAWLGENRPVETAAPQVAPARYPVKLNGAVVADKDYILAHLRDPRTLLLDARSPEEYVGSIRRATRGGHIPGAINFNWTDAIDPNRKLRLKPAEVLKEKLAALGVTPDKEIVTYCQTHHRSAHTYFVLKYLGYRNVKGYPGSWSEWGNTPNLPIE